MRALFITYLLWVSSFSLINAQAVLEFQTYLSGFSSPVDITNAGDGSNRLFVVERGGQIKIIKNNAVLPTPFLDISGFITSGGEQGLLGMAFHPNYVSNGFFFVNYTDTNGDTRIVRFGTNSSNPDLADPSNREIILTVAQPFFNHNAGDLAFGPDGYLYIPLGDGGSGGDPGNRSQNTMEMLGKMLRIDVDGALPYTVPASNPFVGNTAVLDEIWAIGLRNPWRISFDRSTGDLWIGDVGQSAWEEISFQPASSTGGENYGWRCYEGNQIYNNTGCGPMSSYTFPVFDVGRSNATGAKSITGGFVYRGTQYPNLVGKYIFCDYITDNCWTLEPDGSGGWTSELFNSSGMVNCSSFGEAENGELYALNLNGIIYETIDANALPVELLTFEGRPKQDQNILYWISASEENTDYYELQHSSNATTFTPLVELRAAGNSIEEQEYEYIDANPFKGPNYYRLKMVDFDGSFQFSKIIQLDQSLDQQRISLHPNPAKEEVFIRFDQVLNEPVSVAVYDLSGRRLIQQTGLQPIAEQRIDLSTLIYGMYLIEVNTAKETYRKKLLITP